MRTTTAPARAASLRIASAAAALGFAASAATGSPAASASRAYADDLGRGTVTWDAATGTIEVTAGATTTGPLHEADPVRAGGVTVVDVESGGVRVQAALSDSGTTFVATVIGGASVVELHASGSACTVGLTTCVPPVPELPCRVQGRFIVCTP